MNKYIEELSKRYPALERNAESIYRAYEIMAQSYVHGGKLLIAGNGGSAADADHIVGELMKRFLHDRTIGKDLAARLLEIDDKRGEALASKLQKALPAIALHHHTALNTAIANDVDNKLCYAQQVLGYGMEQDVLLAISTSGQSENIIYAAITAKALGLQVIGLTGRIGGELKQYADVSILVDGDSAQEVQELHVPVYHCLCRMLEDRFFT